MSHTTTLKSVQIKDVRALRQAIVDLKKKGVNCDLVENEKPRMYYGSQHGSCPFVLRLHDSKYDVGFDRQEDGTYSPVFDEWNGHVKNQIGPICPVPTDTSELKAAQAIGHFSQRYAVNAATNAAMAQGHTVTGTSTDKHGNVHLTVQVSA